MTVRDSAALQRDKMVILDNIMVNPPHLEDRWGRFFPRRLPQRQASDGAECPRHDGARHNSVCHRRLAVVAESRTVIF